MIAKTFALIRRILHAQKKVFAIMTLNSYVQLD